MTAARTCKAFALVVGLVGLLSTGCAIDRSSLASNTGPKPAKGQWSAATEQWVHVGEDVDFSYVLLTGAADYAILEVLPLDIAKVSLEADPGRFYFQRLKFTQPTSPDKPLIVRATAYRERGARDHMDLNGQLLSRESPQDVSDSKVSRTEMRLHVYQSVLTIQVPADPAGYQWETAKLMLHARSENPTEIRQDRDYRKGFRVVGPGAAGTYLVTYEPACDQVNRCDTTRVTFTVRTAAGQEHRQEILLPTP